MMDSSKLQKILNALPDMYLVLDADGVVLGYKPALTDRSPLSPEKYLGKQLADVLPPHTAKEALDSVQKVLASGDERRMSYSLEAEGEMEHFQARFTRLDDGEVLAMIRDVTGHSGTEGSFKVLIDASPDMSLLLDMDGRILAINARAAAAYGKRVEELIGTSYWELLDKEKASLRKQKLTKVFRTGEPEQVIDISGDLVFEVNARPLTGSEGRVTSVAFFIRDITEKVKTDNDLIESEARYRQLFEKNPIPMYIYDMDTLNIIDVNRAVIDNYQYSRDEIKAMTIKDIRPPEDVEKLMENVSDLRSGQVYLGQWRHCKKDGSIIDVEITSIDFPHKEMAARLVLCNDVTEKVRIGRELEESESKFRSIVESSPMGMHMYRLEDDGRLVFTGANPAADTMLGVDNSQFVGMTSEEAFPSAADTEIPDRYREVCRTGDPWNKEQIDYEDEKIRGAFEVHAFKTGHNAMAAMFLDITERKIAAKALAQSEEKFRQAFHTNPDPMVINRIDDRVILDVNNGFINTTGYSREESMGRTPAELGLWLDDGFREQVATKIREEGKLQNVEANVRTKNGSIMTVLFSGTLITLGNEPAMLTIARDITDLKVARDALSESEERFRSAFETSPDIIAIVDLEKRTIVDVNEGLVFNTGYVREEVIGRSSVEVGIWDDASGRDRFYEAIAETGKVEGLEADFRMKDGTIRNGLVSARIMDLSGHPHLFITIRDITGLMEIQEQLKDSLSEKEILLKEIHHRVKNNLQVISGLLNLQAHHINDPLSREIYKESQNRVITMALIHEELYQSEDLGQVQFGDYIQNLCNNLMISYGADSKRIDLKVDAVRADLVVDTVIPCGLIINELVTNSLKHAFPEGGMGVITVTFRMLPDELFEMMVSDDGIGIPEDIDINSTSTLGMQLVTVLVQQLGGTLEVRGDKGTTFIMTFREYHEAGTALY
jgi:PAS domain S-box-containing protein